MDSTKMSQESTTLSESPNTFNHHHSSGQNMMMELSGKSAAAEVSLTAEEDELTTTEPDDDNKLDESQQQQEDEEDLNFVVTGKQMVPSADADDDGDIKWCHQLTSCNKLESQQVWIPKVSFVGVGGANCSSANCSNSVEAHQSSLDKTTTETDGGTHTCGSSSEIVVVDNNNKFKSTTTSAADVRSPRDVYSQLMQEEDMVDITEDFTEAVKSLELGELLHDPTFGLFEAMSAIEMMDSKMDAGMICNKGKRPPILTFDQAVQEGFLCLDNVSMEDHIGIIDTTISCLVTWIDGHSLAQTVFTNLYLHRPTAIGDKYLKATSVAALKLVDVIEECISKAGVFEEEDFQPSVYGYNLATMFTDSKTSSMLRECEDDLQKKARLISKAQQQQQQKPTTINNNTTNTTQIEVDSAATAVVAVSEEIQQQNNYDMERIDALLGRLKFLRLFHSLILHIWKRDDTAECSSLIVGCQEALTLLQKTSSLGTQRSTDESDTFMVGYELLVNQRLLPPTFPRSTKIKSSEDAFKFLDGLLCRIKTVLKVTTIQNFHGIVDFFHAFSESRPCVLSRSLLQLLYGPMRFKKPGLDDMMDSMKESVRGFISPPVLSSKFKGKNREVSECVDMFFERSATVFANLLIGCGHNRARLRDKLAHMMEDFANLQIETEKIDNYIHSLCLQMDGVRQHGNCFGTWLLCHISKHMIRYLYSGFELELYSLHEYAYIYWYLHEFLYAWLLSTYSRAEAYMVEGETLSNEKNGKKAGKNRTKNNKAKSKAYTKELLILQAEQNLTGGYFKTLMGLINDNRIPFPNIEFDNESVRYRHRFSPFTPMQTPSLVHYMQYKQIRDLAFAQPAENLYLAATKNFLQAKQLLEAIPGSEKEVSDLLKIAKTNFVVVKLLASGHTKDSRTPPEFDFSSHMHFPVMKLI